MLVLSNQHKLPVTNQCLLGDFQNVARNGQAMSRSVSTQQFRECTVNFVGNRRLRPSFAFPGGSDRFNADF
jgi:hypothetical protein